MNIDATHKEEGSIFAMIIRDNDGKLLLLSTKFLKCNLSHEVEKLRPGIGLQPMLLVDGRMFFGWLILVK